MKILDKNKEFVYDDAFEWLFYEWIMPIVAFPFIWCFKKIFGDKNDD